MVTRKKLPIEESLERQGLGDHARSDAEDTLRFYHGGEARIDGEVCGGLQTRDMQSGYSIASGSGRAQQPHFLILRRRVGGLGRALRAS